jgi:hypothetical protein
MRSLDWSADGSLLTLELLWLRVRQASALGAVANFYRPTENPEEGEGEGEGEPKDRREKLKRRKRWSISDKSSLLEFHSQRIVDLFAKSFTCFSYESARCFNRKLEEEDRATVLYASTNASVVRLCAFFENSFDEPMVE